MASQDHTHFQDAVDEVEHRLHVELIPGTEILTDLTTTHFIHGKHKDVVLVPQPSMTDIHDPLVRCWTQWRNETLTIGLELEPVLEIYNPLYMYFLHVPWKLRCPSHRSSDSHLRRIL